MRYGIRLREEHGSQIEIDARLLSVTDPRLVANGKILPDELGRTIIGCFQSPECISGRLLQKMAKGCEEAGVPYKISSAYVVGG